LLGFAELGGKFFRLRKKGEKGGNLSILESELLKWSTSSRKISPNSPYN